MLLEYMTHENLNKFVGRLIEDYIVYGPVPNQGDWHKFERLENQDQLCLEYVSTVLPPKKLLAAQKEELLEFNRKNNTMVAKHEAPKQIILGVHPCDIWGIYMLDWAFSQGNPDPNYLARRRNTLIIGVDCIPDEECFCNIVHSSQATVGFDLFLHRVDTGFFIEVGSQKGQDLLIEKGETTESTAEEQRNLQRWAKVREEAYKKKLSTAIENMPLILSSAYQDPVWEDLDRRCFGCGSCNIVCPTCYCFDVQENMSLDLNRGVRVRQWDGCLLEDFAVVAGGENFRESRASRNRHRFYRKFKYQMQRFGKSHCVGCGRCSRACLAEIKPIETLEAILQNMQKALAETPLG